MSCTSVERYGVPLGKSPRGDGSLTDYSGGVQDRGSDVSDEGGGELVGLKEKRHWVCGV